MEGSEAYVEVNLSFWLLSFCLVFFPESVLFYVSVSEGMFGTLLSTLRFEPFALTTYSARAAGPVLFSWIHLSLRQLLDRTKTFLSFDPMILLTGTPPHFDYAPK